MKQIIVTVKMSVHDGYTLSEIRTKVHNALCDEPSLGYFLDNKSKISAHYDRSTSPRKRKKR